MARIAALSPGQSPPPVRTPIRITAGPYRPLGGASLRAVVDVPVRGRRPPARVRVIVVRMLLPCMCVVAALQQRPAPLREARLDPVNRRGTVRNVWLECRAPLPAFLEEGKPL